MKPSEICKNDWGKSQETIELRDQKFEDTASCKMAVKTKVQFYYIQPGLITFYKQAFISKYTLAVTI